MLNSEINRGAGDQCAHPHPPCDLLDLVKGPIEEIVGRFVTFPVNRRGRPAPRCHNLALGHQSALHHVRQHLIGAGTCRRKVDVWRIAGRRLEQSGEHGRLGQCQFTDLLAEIELGSRCDPERAAAHIGPVKIELKDLLLGQVRFKPCCEKCFLDLALERPLVRQEQVLGKLLGDRRSALDHGIGPRILEHCARQAHEVDAEMLKKTPVLGRQNRLDNDVGHRVDGYGLALQDAALSDLVAIAVEKRDRIVVLRAPVLRRFLEGRHGKRQHDDRTGRAKRKALREKLDRRLAPAGDAEPAEEDRDVLPPFAGRELRLVQGRIDPGIDLEQFRRLWALRVSPFERILHGSLLVRSVWNRHISQRYP